MMDRPVKKHSQKIKVATHTTPSQALNQQLSVLSVLCSHSLSLFHLLLLSHATQPCIQVILPSQQLLAFIFQELSHSHHTSSHLKHFLPSHITFLSIRQKGSVHASVRGMHMILEFWLCDGLFQEKMLDGDAYVSPITGQTPRIMATVGINLIPEIKIKTNNPRKEHINEGPVGNKVGTKGVHWVVNVGCLITKLSERKPPKIKPPQKVPHHLFSHPQCFCKKENPVSFSWVFLEALVGLAVPFRDWTEERALQINANKSHGITKVHVFSTNVLLLFTIMYLLLHREYWTITNVYQSNTKVFYVYTNVH